MTTLDRYILLKIAQTFCLVCLILLGIIWLTQSLRLLETLTESAIPVRLFLFLVALSAPNFFYVILPISAAIATLIALHRLSFDHEMIAMIATGVSPARLARPALLFAVVMAALTFYLGAFGVPLLNQKFLQLTSLIKDEYATVLFRGNSFRRISPQVTIYIQERRDLENLYGILLHDARDPKAPITLVAESGAIAQTPDGIQLTLINGNRGRGIGENIDILRFGRYIVTLNPQTNQAASPRLSSELPLPELWARASQSRDTRGRLHHVLSLPLFVLLAAGIVLAIRLRTLSPRFDPHVSLHAGLALGLAQILYLAAVMIVRADHAPPILIYLVLLACLSLASPRLDPLVRAILGRTTLGGPETRAPVRPPA